MGQDGRDGPVGDPSHLAMDGGHPRRGRGRPRKRSQRLPFGRRRSPKNVELKSLPRKKEWGVGYSSCQDGVPRTSYDGFPPWGRELGGRNPGRGGGSGFKRAKSKAKAWLAVLGKRRGIPQYSDGSIWGGICSKALKSDQDFGRQGQIVGDDIPTCEKRCRAL